MVYSKLSYPTGERDNCTVILNDAKNEISTSTDVYKCSDDIYVLLYLLSNKAISTIYKLIDDEINKRTEEENQVLPQ